MGRYAPAEQHLLRGLELRHAHLGPEHPETLGLMNDLASVIRDSGRWAEARALFQRVLEAIRRVLGPEHTGTLSSIAYLALIDRDRGDTIAARAGFEHVLDCRRRVLGPDHPDTIDTMCHLAFTLRHHGAHQEALPLIRRVIQDQRRLLGPEHPRTLDAIENLAYWKVEENSMEEARNMLESLLVTRRRVLGEAHTDTIATLVALAGTLAGQGKWDQAAARYEEALGRFPESVGGRLDLAIVELERGRQAAFLRHRDWLLRQAERDGTPQDAERIAKIASLIPGAAADRSRPMELARRAMAVNPENGWFLLAAGAAAYRAGDLQDAIDRLERARDRLSCGPGRVEADLFLVIALRGTGRTEQSRQVLSEAIRLVAQNESAASVGGDRPGVAWPHWVTAKVLIREAEASADDQLPPVARKGRGGG